MQVRITLRTRYSSAPLPSPFSSAFLPQHFLGASLLGSFMGHAIALVCLPVVAQLFGFLASSDVPVDVSSYHVEMQKLQAPETIYYTSKIADRKKTPVPAPAPATAARDPGGAASPAPADPKPATRSAAAVAQVRQGLELPAPPKVESTMSAILLQPDFQPKAPAVETLPPLTFWARDTPVPRQQFKPVITPGRSEAAAPMPQLDAPPVLAVSNRQPELSNLNIALQPTDQAHPPALPVPNSATVPIREKSDQAQGGALDRQPGDSTNLIAISPKRVPPGQVLNVPRGLRSLPQPGQPAGGESGPSAGSSPSIAPSAPPASAAAGRGNGGQGASTNPPSKTAGVDSTLTNGHAKGNGADQANTPDSAARTSSSRANAEPARVAAVGSARGGNGAAAPVKTTAAPGGDSAGAATSARADTPVGRGSVTPPAPERPIAPPAALGPVIQINHPSNGNFDVVITQSTPSDDSPELAALLTGNPVYTVYLQVGDRREWLLEYCVPVSGSNRNSQYQVFVGDATPVSPPYPISTVIPEHLPNVPHPKDIVFHGYLSKEGTFRDLAARDAGNQLAHQIAPLLAQWRFRPPTRDKVPVEVEVVLVVPKVQ